jgi:putative hydrolase of the HAD superfamily
MRSPTSSAGGRICSTTSLPGPIALLTLPGAIAFLDYWFARDALPDARMMQIKAGRAARGLRQVIATNNEGRRASYIEHEMEFGQRVEATFSSGRMGPGKPETAFFDTVSKTLGVAADRLILIDDSLANVAAEEGLG